MFDGIRKIFNTYANNPRTEIGSNGSYKIFEKRGKEVVLVREGVDPPDNDRTKPHYIKQYEGGRVVAEGIGVWDESGKGIPVEGNWITRDGNGEYHETYSKGKFTGEETHFRYDGSRIKEVVRDKYNGQEVLKETNFDLGGQRIAEKIRTASSSLLLKKTEYRGGEISLMEERDPAKDRVIAFERTDREGRRSYIDRDTGETKILDQFGRVTKEGKYQPDGNFVGHQYEYGGTAVGRDMTFHGEYREDGTHVENWWHPDTGRLEKTTEGRSDGSCVTRVFNGEDLSEHIHTTADGITKQTIYYVRGKDGYQPKEGAAPLVKSERSIVKNARGETDFVGVSIDYHPDGGLKKVAVHPEGDTPGIDAIHWNKNGQRINPRTGDVISSVVPDSDLFRLREVGVHIGNNGHLSPTSVGPVSGGPRSPSPAAAAPGGGGSATGVSSGVPAGTGGGIAAVSSLATLGPQGPVASGGARGAGNVTSLQNQPHPSDGPPVTMGNLALKPEPVAPLDLQPNPTKQVVDPAKAGPAANSGTMSPSSSQTSATPPPSSGNTGGANPSSSPVPSQQPSAQQPPARQSSAFVSQTGNTAENTAAVTPSSNTPNTSSVKPPSGGAGSTTSSATTSAEASSVPRTSEPSSPKPTPSGTSMSQKIGGHVGRAELALGAAVQVAEGHVGEAAATIAEGEAISLAVKKGSLAASEALAKQGLKSMGGFIGPAVTIGFGAAAVIDKARGGHYAAAAIEGVTVGAEAFANALPSGVGGLAVREAFHAAVKNTFGEKYAPEKSGLRKATEAAVDVASALIAGNKYSSMATKDLKGTIAHDETLPKTVPINGKNVPLTDALEDKAFRTKFIENLEKAGAKHDLGAQISMVKAYDDKLNAQVTLAKSPQVAPVFMYGV